MKKAILALAAGSTVLLSACGAADATTPEMTPKQHWVADMKAMGARFPNGVDTAWERAIFVCGMDTKAAEGLATLAFIDRDDPKGMAQKYVAATKEYKCPEDAQS